MLRACRFVAEMGPKGFKILLEILVSSGALTTSEVPFSFGQRYSGQSKASLREGTKYLRRLVELRAHRRRLRLAA